jgi:hypothetical protein
MTLYKINDKNAEKVGTVTFTELGMQENDVEEISRRNIDMLCDEEESLLIVGFPQDPPLNERLTALQSALFMIGYDVR